MTISIFTAADVGAVPADSTFPNSDAERNVFLSAVSAFGDYATHGVGHQPVGATSGAWLYGDGTWSYSGTYVASYSGVTDTQTGSATDGFQAFHYEGGALHEDGAPGGNKKNWLGIEGVGSTLTFTNKNPTHSFGAFFTGLSGAVEITFNDGTSQQLTIPSLGASGGVEYWGFTDTYAFSTFTITDVSGDNFGIDGISFNEASRVVDDFSDDGISDILWRNSNGSLAEWLMNGSAISSSAFVTSGGSAVAPDTSWSVVGVGDFNGDGDADILWRQSSTGALVEWLMNGSTITSSAYVTSGGSAVAPDSSWSVVGVGDFNGDGDADVLWRNSNGSLAEWLMNGSAISSSAFVTSGGSVVAPDSSWSVAGIGDFNGDGDADVLWRQSTTGSLAMWLMNGSTITSSAYVTSGGSAVAPDSSWSVVGVGDFNGDGDADILWRQSSTGSLAMWLMNGSTIESSAAVTFQGSAVAPDSTWNVVEIGDFNGSNQAGIIWQQNTTGTLAEWQMNGAQIASSQSVTYGGTPIGPPSSWQVQAHPTDFV